MGRIDAPAPSRRAGPKTLKIILVIIGVAYILFPRDLVPDRLGRGDAIAKLELLAEMNGCKIVYAQKRFDTSTIEGYVQKTADQLASGIERIKIGERTVRGKRSYARDGRVIASGRRPYGYRYVSQYDERGRKVSCKLEIVEEEANIVRQIFYRCAIEGWTSYRIARKLTEMHVPTMSDIEGRRTIGTYGHWAQNSVLGMLRNQTYMGVWHYGKNKVKRLDGKTITTTVTKRKEGDPHMIAVPVPAIIEPEIWELAQRKLEENRRKNFKPTKYRYLLRHTITCIHDGANMSGITSNGIGYYHCVNGFTRYPGERCTARYLRQDAAERLVWDYICEMFLDIDNLLVHVREKRQKEKEAHKAIIASIGALNAMDAKDRRKIDRLLDLYLNEGIGKAAFEAKKEAIEEKIRRREVERTELQSRLASTGMLTEDEENELRAFGRMLAGTLGDMSFEEKRRILTVLDVKCVWNDETDELTVSGAFRGTTLNVTSSCSAC